jgi:hypothetical protein
LQQLKHFSDELMRIGELLSMLLDFVAMYEENRFVVKMGNAAELDESAFVF